MDRTVELLPSRLYWLSRLKPPRVQPKSFYVSTDKVLPTQELVYQSFNQDFGPFSLALTYKFCSQLEKLLADPKYQGYTIYHHTSLDPHKRANSAFLIGAFSVLVLKRSAKEAWEPFSRLPAFQPFRDACAGPCWYDCTILHCLRGLQRATRLGWFNYNSFDAEDFEFYEQVENGDFNWIIPDKLLAFSAPSTEQEAEDWKVLTVADYAKLFKRMGVTAVVRLNEPNYEAEVFRSHGIKLFDLFFLDGSCPSYSIVNQFISIVNAEKGCVAVHCKAGLGRTGTLIACYAMKQYTFPAEEFIGWCRLCRPGSILGPQQFFLFEFERRHKTVQSAEAVQQGDKGQGARLLRAKLSNQKRIESLSKDSSKAEVARYGTAKVVHRSKK